MLMLALLVAAGSLDPGTPKVFGDWAVACDNVKACEMTALLPDMGDWGDDLLTASIARTAGPQGGFALTIDCGDAAGMIEVAIDGTRFAGGTTRNATLRFAGADAARIVAALAKGSALTLTSGKGRLGSLSLQGASAALRFIDAAQGRTGTVTAAVAKGSRPAAAVPTPPAAARIPALRGPAGRAETIGPALRARMTILAECEAEAEEPAAEIATAALPGGATLALLPCGSGAYNSSFVPFILRGGAAALAPVDHDEEGAIAETATLTNAWWDAKAGQLATQEKGRGIGDCGEAARYVWDGTRFRLIELRRMDICRGATRWLRVWTAQPVYR